MALRRTLLLAHAHTSGREPLRAALSSELDVRVAASLEDALARVRAERIDLAVLDESFGLPLLEALEELAPELTCAVLLGDPPREEWVRALGDGHVFLTLPRSLAPERLIEKLRALLYPRRAERHRPEQQLTLRMETAALREFAVADLSHQGLAFRLLAHDSARDFIPGSQLEHLSLWQGSQRLLSGVRAEVRHLEPSGAAAYQVGLALQPARAERVILHDFLERLALLQGALRRGNLFLQNADGTGSPVRVRAGQSDTARGTLQLDLDRPSGGAPGDILSGSFDAWGTRYAFLTSVRASERGPPGSAERLLVALPGSLQVGASRASRRFQPTASAAIELEFVPVGGVRPVRCSVLDISTSGLAFLTDERRAVPPVGTHLAPLTLHLRGGKTAQARGEVLYVRPRERLGAPWLQCGVKLHGLGREEQVLLMEALLYSDMPGVAGPEALTFEGLWAFLRSTGFIYPEKEEKLQPARRELEATLSRLLAEPNPVLKTLLFRPDGRLQGHLSALWAYPKTWMVQHLAARQDVPEQRTRAARILNLAMVEYFGQLPDVEFMRVYFRPNNKWPRRAFGGFARMKAHRGGCHLRTYGYFVAPTAEAVAESWEGICVRRATGDDEREVERWLLAHEHPLVLRANDLTREGFGLAALAESYRALGLERGRELLVALREGRLVGFALDEHASPGLNLSDLASAFTLYAVEPDAAAAASLASHCRARGRARGRGFSIALTDARDALALGRAGFRHVKDYSVWTLHRSHLPRYQDYVLRMYERAQFAQESRAARRR